MLSETIPAPIPGSLAVGVIAAAWTLLLSLLVGAAVLGRLDSREPAARRSVLDSVLSWIVLGTALQSLAWLALSSLGALGPSAVVSLAVASTTVAGFAARRPISAALRVLESSRSRESRSAEAIAGSLLLCVGTLSVLALATRPTRFYDDLVYHLGLPRQALLTGSWPALADFHYSFMPAGWDASYLLSFALGSAAGAQLQNAVLFALFAVAVLRLARVVTDAGPGPAALSASLLVLCPMIVSLGAFAGDDLFVGFALVVALTRIVGGSGDLRTAAVAGLLAGAAWSAKYTALPGAAGCGLAWLLLNEAPGWKRRLQGAAAFGAGVLAPAAAWNLRAWWLTGNPLYPAFHGLLGGRPWSAESAHLVAREVAHGAVPENGVSAFLSGAWRLLTDADGMGYPAGLNPLLPWLGILALLLPPFTRRRLALSAAAAVSYAGWCLTSLNQRYALFLLALLAAAAAAVLHRISELRPVVRHSACALLLAAAAHQGYTAVKRHVEFCRMHPEEPQLSRVGMMSALGAWRAGVELDESLPPEARLLVVAEGRLALFPRPARVSSAYDRPVIAPFVEGEPSLPEMSARARAAGLTHVAVNHGELARWIEGYRWVERLPPDGIDRFHAWLRFECRPVGRWGPVEVRAVPPAP